MNTPSPHPQAQDALGTATRHPLNRLSPRQRQYALLLAIVAGGVGLLWIIFSLAGTGTSSTGAPTAQQFPGKVTTMDVLPPGGQVNPVDQWVGTAGRKLAQYETEREEQGRVNQDRQAFEARTMQRFAELEQRLTTPPQPAPAAAAVDAEANMVAANTDPAAAGNSASRASTFPPATGLPLPPRIPYVSAGGLPTSHPIEAPAAPVPTITRVKVSDGPRSESVASADGQARNDGSAARARTVTTFLPVSFTRGILLGGLDAPTGGQAQSNPHPVLIQLSDNSVLPNQFRAEYRECFVIAAGYGDISSERAYLRTESLSCVRADGASLEVRIQGSVYGEDGKVGMRGRLVTKQGQMLANALLAGVVSGIGQGLATANTTYTTTPLGTVASAEGSGDHYRSGLGSGVGRALDRLAQYYIKLAENTFPVIEVDAGRQVDVVITRGVRIELPVTSSPDRSTPLILPPESRFLEAPDDNNY